MDTKPIETITFINGTIKPQINWITKPIGKLSDLKALARIYKGK